MKKVEFTKDQIEIIKIYIKLIGKRIHHPSLGDMEKAGVTYAKIRHHFENALGLRKAAKEFSPDTFLNIIDSDVFNKKMLRSIEDKVGKKQVFAITTAVTGCQVHKGFMKSLERFCGRNGAMKLILPSTDPAARAGWSLDGMLKKEAILMADMSVNSNLFISSIKLSAKQIDPVTGLDRFGHRQGSFIYASPKQRLRVIPNAKDHFPKISMSTGACTIPNYSTDRYMSERTAYISTVDHVIGALIVEVVDGKLFHVRQIQAEKSGAFVDMGVYYKPDGIGKLLPAARILGDYHSGQTDPVAEETFMRLQMQIPAARVFFHDIFNGLSCNHHESNKHILRAIRYLGGELLIEQDVGYVKETLEKWGQIAEELVVVKSNHDLFLNRYLDEGRYTKDYPNKIFALKLALAMAEGQDPLKYAVDRLLACKASKQTKWLNSDSSYKIAGIELGDHGDKYATSSLINQEKAYGQAVTAHVHTPEILRGIYRVGTTSLLDLGYNAGPGGWMHTGCDVYPNGARQLITAINGRWGLNDKV